MRSLMALLALSLLVTGQVAQGNVPPALESRQAQLYSAYDKVRDTVVGISDGLGVGSGVLVSEDGLVLTASHVIESSRRRSQFAREIMVTMTDGSRYRAEMLGRNRDADAAMLRIVEPREGNKPFPHANVGQSGTLSPGEWCFALGYPGGFSEKRKAPIRAGRILSIGERTVISDCSIVLGDSGGPLFDLEGRVIGIHSMITSLIIENRHVAVDAWNRDWDRFLDGQSWGRLRNYDNQLVESDFFGVGLKWKDFRPEIAHVIPESPADRAGLRPGDQLLKIAGERFADRLDLGTVLAQLGDQQSIDVVLLRNNDPQTVSLVTGQRAEDDDTRRRRFLDADERSEIEEQLSQSRRIGPWEKRAPDQLELFEPGIRDARESVVAVRDGGLLLCLGTVVGADGYILAKASEMHGAIDPEVIIPNGKRFSARQVGLDHSFDLALLRVDATDLKPVTFQTTTPARAGQLAVIQDSRGNPLIPTVVSVAARSLGGAGTGFMGVVLDDAANGVRILQVLPGGSAERNGLRGDDVIRSINGTTMTSRAQVIQKVKQFRPGEKLTVRFDRGGKDQTVELVLTPRFMSEDAMLDLYSDEELMGQFSSIHSGGFPEAIQIDADLYPRQAGGPLLDLEGRAIGITIARAGRVVSYAIPAAAAKRVYETLRNAQPIQP